MREQIVASNVQKIGKYEVIDKKALIAAKLMPTVYPGVDIRAKILSNWICIYINHDNEHYGFMIASRCIHLTMIKDIVDNDKLSIR